MTLKGSFLQQRGHQGQGSQLRLHDTITQESASKIQIPGPQWIPNSASRPEICMLASSTG